MIQKIIDLNLEALYFLTIPDKNTNDFDNLIYNKILSLTKSQKNRFIKFTMIKNIIETYGPCTSDFIIDESVNLFSGITIKRYLNYMLTSPIPYIKKWKCPVLGCYFYELLTSREIRKAIKKLLKPIIAEKIRQEIDLFLHKKATLVFILNQEVFAILYKSGNNNKTFNFTIDGNNYRTISRELFLNYYTMNESKRLFNEYKNILMDHLSQCGNLSIFKKKIKKKMIKNNFI